MFLIVTTLLWGGNAAFGKMAVGHVSPMVLTLSRWILALAIISAIAGPQLRRDWPLIRRNLHILLGLGAVGYTAFNGFLYSALQYTTGVNGAIEQGGIPVLIFVLNFVLFRVPVTAVQIAGFAISFFGVVLTASHGDLATLAQLNLNYGDALLLVAVLAYALYTVGLRWKPAIHWKSMMAAASLGAAIAAVPPLLYEIAQAKAIWPDHIGIGVILYTAIFPSLVSQILYIKGVEGIGANRAGLFINLVPVFGTGLSVLLNGERLEPFHFLALVLVIGGIAISEWGKPRPVETIQ
nr:DMT family transporter [Rhizobium halophytocola]